MAATLMLACSNDKSGGHDGGEGVETEVNGTQLDGNTTLYGLVTDTSGNPVPGVVVSDGYGCVETDANGVYQMERYKKARFVHYSTPAGYAVNTSADNYPLFYSEIVHKNIADRHDFVLTPLPAPESDFTLVCIADPQCSTTAEISRYVNETIPDIEATADAYKAKGTPVYGITLGDIVFDTPDLWSNMKESMANRNLPVFQTIGNHDHLQTETSDDNAAANFETQFGPRNYSFNRGDVHIVSMDNVLYEGKKKYKGGITDKQLEWLRQDLSHVDKDKLVIFCAHIPFRGAYDLPLRYLLLGGRTARGPTGTPLRPPPDGGERLHQGRGTGRVCVPVLGTGSAGTVRAGILSDRPVSDKEQEDLKTIKPPGRADLFPN